MIKVLVTTALFGGRLYSKWVDQISDRYEIVFNRIDDDVESPRIKAMSSRLRGKIPKMLVWEDYPGYDYYIWMDSSFSLLKSDAIEKMVDYCIGWDACFFKHPARTSVKQELDFVVELMRNNNEYLVERYSGEKMTEQVDFYMKDPTWKDNILLACGTFIYSKSIIENKEYNLMKEWFYQNCLWSVQDQLSFPYLLHKFKTNFRLLEGSVYSNYYTS
jgi:hypothetical protein